MSLESIKAKLAAQQAEREGRFVGPPTPAGMGPDCYCSYSFEAWWPTAPVNTYWGVSYIDYDEGGEIQLEYSDLDVRIGNPDRYDKNFRCHPVMEEVEEFLTSHEMPHELFYNEEMEGPHTLIVRLTNETDRLYFYMGFGEFTAFKE